MEPNFSLKLGQHVQVQGRDGRLTWAQVIGLDGYWVTVQWLTPRLAPWSTDILAIQGETHRTRLINIVP